ncbi:nonsense-mediated mRNA decay factor SMG7-like [Phragmites australis]|uniref:nonsense-mediated mRNA decay factor SMG7-like n=1 Tax=Phragmites australis TaxID=29695 RepID=UPI002D791E28|nr:nonsense-mediated mRNA decay factor SMG7-like [Phragmites australis]XP_062199977.1 nonsense-mediated mRNA decay factor SMG7-like [Phragmites australis]
MMTVPMDSATAAPSSRDLAERLFKKNGELENQLRKSVQSKVPSDPNIWIQMRDNFEKIIVADHDFSEQQEIEYHLWQLHYKRIEEFRRNIISAGSVAAHSGKSNANLDRIRRIKSAFRSFLSEATGFYHDLMLKIKSNYGLPLGYFPEGLENAGNSVRDDKKTAEVKKGLVSCHRCLIYLGDLARYKSLHGDDDSASREYATASSYYKEAASICPSSGNPHHQLAILASYSGNEVVSVYRYFRSLAAETPFATARDNLIILFEKNRQSYAQLSANNKGPTARTLPPRSSGRGRGRGEARFQPRDVSTEAAARERECSVPETLKAFYVRFVRLNGILFTRTSLETFGELFASVSNDLQILLSSGPEEELNFGSDTVENSLAVVRLTAILIFTVHNVKKEPDSQSYVEIVQRRVLLQSAFTAAFEFVGQILKRCSQLRDIASSFYLPAIMVYIEWLASHPELAVDSEMEEKHANARSFFWNQCILFMNKLILTDLASIDGDNDEACFSNMSTYEEGETGNRLALWEDLELRGFLPLLPAQIILDFSSKQTFRNVGSTKEKKARVQRIFAAGKSLLNFVQIDQLRIYFDPSSKKFVMAEKPPVFEANTPPHESLDALKMSASKLDQAARRFDSVSANLGVLQSKVQLCPEGDDDEEIVFKPIASEKFPKTPSELSVNGYAQPVQMSAAGWPTNGGSVSVQSTTSMSAASWPTNGMSVSIQSTGPVSAAGNYNINQSLPMSSISWAVNGEQKVIPSIAPRYEFVQPVDVPASSWASNGTLHVGPQNAISTFPDVVFDPRASAPMVPRFSSPDYSKLLREQELLLMSGLKNVNITGNGYLEQRLQGGLSGLQPMGYSPQISIESCGNITNLIHNQVKATGETIPSTLDSVVPSVAPSNGVTLRFTEAPLVASKKNPVSRPSKPVGPPPGFNHITPKRQDDSISVEKLQNPQVDDYSWLDGYQPSLDCVNNLKAVYPDVSATSTAFTTPFPFPGKQQQASGMHNHGANERTWQDFHLFEPAKQNMFQNYQQRNQQTGQMAEQESANPIWSSRYLV